MGKRMGKVLQFPRRNVSDSLRTVMCEMQSHKPSPIETPWVLSESEDAAFLHLIREWPCFLSIEEELDLHQIFEQYYEDRLTMSQDCVLEFLFHMREPDSFFDIGNALYTWEEEDRTYFFASLSLQAEIIDQIKKEEC